MVKKTIFICFSTSEGSLSEYFVGFSNELSKKYEVIIFSDKRYRPEKLFNKIHLFYWPSKRPTHLRDFIFYFKHLINKKPILTISLFGAANVNIISSYITGVKYRVAWVRSLSTQVKHSRLNRLRKSIVYKFSNKIVANSNATAVDSSKFYKIKSDKLVVLPNSVADYFNDFQYLDINVNKILYVGRLHKSKGVEVLINAFSKLAKKYKSLELHIVGRGAEMKVLKKISRKTGYDERIFFKGNKKKPEVLKEMKTSYVSVVPSHSEAFGFTVIEAMSMKTCVIGADNTGIKEIIKHDKTGLLFKTGNPKDLASKIESILDYPEKRNTIAESGYESFKELYSTESAVQRDTDFFINLIENLSDR